jgi:hypothetical protein
MMRTTGGEDATTDTSGADVERIEGVAYRHGVYHPVAVSELAAAPRTGDFPDPGAGESFYHVDRVPPPPRLRHIIGPSIVALGIGLGAGEFLLWPNLIAVNGFSILWLFVVGVLAQFVVIAEIERWTIATGESIFAGMTRMTRVAFWPWFFVVASLISFFWPGWASQSASFIADAANTIAGREVVVDWQPIAIAMLVFVWVALAASTVVYNALERFELVLVVAFFPLLVLAALLAGASLFQVGQLATGFVSVGSAPRDLLSGDQFPTLLIAVAYAGSGGVLLLGQSLWVRDKGFGMGAYQGRIAGIRGTNEPITQPGFAFSARQSTSRQRFRGWMRLIHEELAVAFVIPIILSVALTGIVVAATIGIGNTDLAGDLTGMVTAQARALEDRAGTWLALAFLMGGALVLFSTQFGIMDTVTRIVGDIVYEQTSRKGRRFTIRGIFLVFLSVLTAASVAIVVLSWTLGRSVEEGGDTLQPDFLIIIAGPFTIASMYAFACIIAVLNTCYLPAPLRMPRAKLVGMYLSILLWGWFTAETITRVTLTRVLGIEGEQATTITLHPLRVVFYGTMLVSLAYVVVRTFTPGFRERPTHGVGGPDAGVER